MANYKYALKTRKLSKVTSLIKLASQQGYTFIHEHGNSINLLAGTPNGLTDNWGLLALNKDNH